jgi:hypothetical protein
VTRMFTDAEMDGLVECSVTHDEEGAAIIRHTAEGRREIERLIAEKRIDPHSGN